MSLFKLDLPLSSASHKKTSSLICNYDDKSYRALQIMINKTPPKSKTDLISMTSQHMFNNKEKRIKWLDEKYANDNKVLNGDLKTYKFNRKDLRSSWDGFLNVNKNSNAELKPMDQIIKYKN